MGTGLQTADLHSTRRIGRVNVQACGQAPVHHEEQPAAEREARRGTHHRPHSHQVAVLITGRSWRRDAQRSGGGGRGIDAECETGGRPVVVGVGDGHHKLPVPHRAGHSAAAVVSDGVSKARGRSGYGDRFRVAVEDLTQVRESDGSGAFRNHQGSGCRALVARVIDRARDAIAANGRGRGAGNAH